MATATAGAWAGPQHDPETSLGDRVVVLAQSAQEGNATAALLRSSGVSTVAAYDVDEMCRLLDEGAACVLVTEEVLAQGGGLPLLEWLARQEPWSDLPVLLLAGSGEPGATSSKGHEQLLAAEGNVTLLDRPVRLVTLLVAISAALRTRQRQYRMRDLLRQLSESVRARDQFLAMLGHELRNPLGAIHTAAELLLSDPTRTGRHAAIIQRQARRLSRLVDDLLEVSRVDSGKVSLKRRVLDLRTAIERSVEAIAPAAERARLGLEQALPAEPLPVDGDPVRLEQVMGNLLSNAVKYTQAGGRIRVEAERRGTLATVRVGDSGIGIAPELLERIFEPFTQAATSLDRCEGGLGLGLALVRGLVTLHGGTVRAHSAGLGKGTEVEVSLPLAIQVELPLAPCPVPGAEECAAPRRHVLVVEDNADNRDTLVMLLESLGHEVVSAVDGPSGVQAGLASRPEVAIVDIGLPGFDGFEVGRRLRAALGPTLKLVALTGYGQPEDRERSRAAGFDVHLTKPAEANELARVVARSRAHAN
jgi:signal transduction histidine kinase/ActR/RegA family two-component response regulator